MALECKAELCREALGWRRFKWRPGLVVLGGQALDVFAFEGRSPDRGYNAADKTGSGTAAPLISLLG